MRWVAGLCSLFLAATSLAFASQRSSGAGTGTHPAQAKIRSRSAFSTLIGGEYLIAPDDLLSVNVVDVPEFSQDYRVGAGGSFMIPMLSRPVRAAGLTPRELAALIASKLRRAGLVTHPYVTVTVKASRVNSVAITGAVKNPQIYPLFGQTNLLNVLSQAGGLSDNAADTAIVTRGEIAMRILGLDGVKGGPVQQTLKVNLTKLLQDGDRQSNVAIYPGDSVTVQQAGIVYVVGAVNRAGGYTMARSWQDMTVLKAIALAGNVTSTARESKAIIIRKEPSAQGGREEIPINLKKVLAGRDPDRRLEANDVLFVPDSTAKKAFRRGAQAALGIGSGLLIYHAPL